MPRTSTVEQVSTRLRDMIWAGELAPGLRLGEVALAKSFSVSRPTIRAAIQRLSAEGLVDYQIHHGATVASLDASDLADLYAVRRLIELAAVQRIPAPGAALRKMHDAVEAMDQYGGRVDSPEMVEHDCSFHAGIVSMLESPRTDRFFVQLTTELRLALGIHLAADTRGIATRGSSGETTAETHQSVVAEHREIYDRIAAEENVVAMLEGHLERAERRVRGLLAAARPGSETEAESDPQPEP